MEFNSQICTSVEQSKRLLELGLKKETADMCYKVLTHNWTGKEIPEKNRHYVKCTWYDENDQVCGMERYKTIPAWSLHRLMEIMYNGDMFGFVGLTTHNRNIDTIYELVIANIEGLIKIDRFNHDYLEEKK